MRRAVLAIHGGTPVRTSGWPDWPPYSPGAGAHLTDVLNSHRWSIRGWFAGRLTKEREFAARFGAFTQAPHCVLVASGSAALVVGLEALGIGFGDEVILPAYTWIATAIAVLSVNAIPVLVDVDPRTGCIDPEAVRHKVTPRTRAIIPVHLHSSIADMHALVMLARQHGLAILEDCAQAHGARLDERPVGSFGNAAAFSMNQEKVLCCGEGGALVTSDDTLFERAQRLKADGSRMSKATPVYGRYDSEDVAGLQGANYCASEFQAAVLLAEFDLLEQRNRQRETSAHHLDELLTALGVFEPLASTAGTTARTYCKYAVRRLPHSFEDVPTALLCEAVTAELGFTVEQTECQPLHKNPLYCPQSKKRHRLGLEYERALDVSELWFPQAEALYDSTLTFHHRILLAEKSDLEDIAEAFAKVARHAGELHRCRA